LRPPTNDRFTGWELRLAERCTFRSSQTTLAWRLPTAMGRGGGYSGRVHGRTQQRAAQHPAGTAVLRGVPCAVYVGLDDGVCASPSRRVWICRAREVPILAYGIGLGVWTSLFCISPLAPTSMHVCTHTWASRTSQKGTKSPVTGGKCEEVPRVTWAN